MDPEKGFSKLLKSSKVKILCRDCFIQEFKKMFLSQNSKTFVMKPCLDVDYDNYFFSTVSDLTYIGFEEKDVAEVKKLIETVPSEKDCAYADVCDLFASSKDGFLKNFENVQVEYLTRDEAWSKVEDSFKRYAGDFDGEGFSSVYRDEIGVFMNMTI